MDNAINARFEIRTQSVSTNKHIAAIYDVLHRNDLEGNLQYVFEANDWNKMRGAAIHGTFPASVVDEINALPIPKSAKLSGWAS